MRRWRCFSTRPGQTSCSILTPRAVTGCDSPLRLTHRSARSRELVHDNEMVINTPHHGSLNLSYHQQTWAEQTNKTYFTSFYKIKPESVQMFKFEQRAFAWDKRVLKNLIYDFFVFLNFQMEDFLAVVVSHFKHERRWKMSPAAKQPRSLMKCCPLLVNI